jgi:hypothetical protein
MRTNAAAIALLLGLAACGRADRQPTTDEERTARGRELIQRMSAHLAGANAFSVTTAETRDRVRTGRDSVRVMLRRELVVRRPDRAHFRASGGVEMEGWYDGKRLTVASHRDKVFAQAPMPPTLDGTIDAITDRYDIPLPLGDLLYSSPAQALLSETAKGGYVGRERVGDSPAEHLAFRDQGVDWNIWFPARGDPLPLRMTIVQPRKTGQIAVDVTFTGWDLHPRTPDSLFVARVPEEYEGVALVQRESAVLPPEPDTTTRLPR